MDSGNRRCDGCRAGAEIGCCQRSLQTRTVVRLSECGRLANINDSPEHRPVLRSMVGFRRAFGFAEATQHYRCPRCSSVLHRSE